jgi:hypothetical protein
MSYGQITGTAIDSATSAPIAGICVQAYTAAEGSSRPPPTVGHGLSRVLLARQCGGVVCLLGREDWATSKPNAAWVALEGGSVEASGSSFALGVIRSTGDAWRASL